MSKLSSLKLGALLTHEQAKAIEILGGATEEYDPSMHCDYSCLRAGKCMGGGCPVSRLTKLPAFEEGTDKP